MSCVQNAVRVEHTPQLASLAHFECMLAPALVIADLRNEFFLPASFVLAIHHFELAVRQVLDRLFVRQTLGLVNV